MIKEKFIPALSPDGASLQILHATVIDYGGDYLPLYEVKDNIGHPSSQKVVNETAYVSRDICFDTVKEALVYTLDEVTRRYEELDRQTLNIGEVEDYCINLLGEME